MTQRLVRARSSRIALLTKDHDDEACATEQRKPKGTGQDFRGESIVAAIAPTMIMTGGRAPGKTVLRDVWRAGIQGAKALVLAGRVGRVRGAGRGPRRWRRAASRPRVV